MNIRLINESELNTSTVTGNQACERYLRASMAIIESINDANTANIYSSAKNGAMTFIPKKPWGKAK